MKIVKTIQLKIVIFTAMKNRCILHGRVFVMKPTNSLIYVPTLQVLLPPKMVENDFMLTQVNVCHVKICVN